MTGDDLRLLTIKQPWAGAIAYGPKRTENRTWLPAYRGLIGIHAGLVPDSDWGTHLPAEHPMFEWMRDQPEFTPYLVGSVLAVAELSDAHAQSSPRCRCDSWAARVGGVTHLVLTNVVPLPEPVPAKGGLGLRRVDPDVYDMLASYVPRLGATG